jgi:DNA-binding response OmpR family regulator
MNTSSKKPWAKILVVDDEERYLNFVSRVLIAEGYEVDTAVGGIDALVKIKGNTYSLLLTGIRMPYMSGFEFYGYVQKIALSLAEKTIIVSASVNSEDTIEFLAENKLTYLAKPFNAEQLKKVVICHYLGLSLTLPVFYSHFPQSLS